MEDREEYVGKLKLELEEKYQETLKVEKQNWLKEQEAAVKEQVETEVIPCGAHWDNSRKGAGSRLLLVNLYLFYFIFPSPGWLGTCHVE